MPDREHWPRSKSFDINELRATSSRNRHRFIADPKSCQEAITTLHEEYHRHLFEQLDAFWQDYFQIIFPYLFRVAEVGATFFPIDHLPEGIFGPDRVRPWVCTRSDLLVWLGEHTKPVYISSELIRRWDYYHAQGFDNAIAQIHDGFFTWFLTW
jgi:hypothetical protein